MKGIVSARSLADAAAFGFGASAGRDLWRWLLKNSGRAFAIVVLLGAATLPVLAGKGLAEGHDRSFAGTVFKTLFCNALLLMVGIAMAWACLLLFTYDEVNPARGAAGALAIAVLWAFALALVGVVWGLVTRPRRKRAFAVAAYNARFLRDNGIAETSASDATHVGPTGERLRLLGNDNCRAVFMVVGRRGQRAYIEFDAQGRFLDYSGPARF